MYVRVVEVVMVTGLEQKNEGRGRYGRSMPPWYRPTIRPASQLRPAALNTDFNEGERSLSYSSVLCLGFRV